MPKMTEPKELLVHELGDLLYAERRFLTSTKGLAREANDPELKERLAAVYGIRTRVDEVGAGERRFPRIEIQGCVDVVCGPPALPAHEHYVK